MKSTKHKVQQCEGMLGTGDLTDWEESFVRDLCDKFRDNSAYELSEKQLAKLDNIYSKHFV